VKKSFDIQELLHHKSKCHETKLMHPFSFRSFQRQQERTEAGSEASQFGGSHQYKTKQTNGSTMKGYVLKITNYI
jgi:hypothetical protein